MFGRKKDLYCENMIILLINAFLYFYSFILNKLVSCFCGQSQFSDSTSSIPKMKRKLMKNMDFSAHALTRDYVNALLEYNFIRNVLKFGAFQQLFRFNLRTCFKDL